MSDAPTSTRPHAYAIVGMHGGYFLTDRYDFDTSVGYLEELAAQRPALVYSMEIEAYTLDRLVNGPQLDVEQRRFAWCREPCPDAWLGPDIAARLKALADQGRLDNVSTYTQPILHALDGEAVVRQFGYARRIQREVLGIELEHYGAQEPCWCGQMPAILNGFSMKGCLFETSWGVYGFAPQRNGEKFRWRGPDGSEIAAVPSSPGMRNPGLERDREGSRHFAPWHNPTHWTLRASTISKALEQGLVNPAAISLALDFTKSTGKNWFDIIDCADDDCDITSVTLATYLDIARDDGLWEDAFAEFEDRLAWGVHGGSLYLESQIAANRTILAQRLSVLHGHDHCDEEDKMWQATMVSQHHDPWLVPKQCFGNWDYPVYLDLIVACRKEVEARADALFPRAESAPFQVTNPTQHARREWQAVALTIPAGEVKGEAAIVDDDGRTVPSRLHASSRHADGSAATVEGFMLAEIDGFRSALYNVGAADGQAAIPTRVTQAEEEWTLANDALKAVVSPSAVRLYRDDVEIVSELFLHAMVEGWDDRSRFTEVDAVLAPSGIAVANAKGVIGCIPFDLELRIRPWSDRFEIQVRCDYEGELTEGTNYWQQQGNLKLIARYPRPASTLLHHPFELRAPGEKTHSAVHFVLTDMADGSGCTLVLDRPSGVVTAEDTIGITLCHSGWSIYGIGTRPGVKGVDGQRYGGGRVHGMQVYDLGIVPFLAEERGRAATVYQAQAYPLQVTAPTSGALPVPSITVTGHSVVSNLSREAYGIVLRFWNPFEDEVISLQAPGMALKSVNLEGVEIETLGEGKAEIPIGAMQIKSVLLQPFSV